MERKRGLIDPYPKHEWHLQQIRREFVYLYQIPQIQQEEAFPTPMAKDPPARRTACKVVIPLTTNITYALHSLEPKVDSSLKRKWCNYCIIVGNSQAYHIRFHSCICRTFYRSVTPSYPGESLQTMRYSCSPPSLFGESKEMDEGRCLKPFHNWRRSGKEIPYPVFPIRIDCEVVKWDFEL